MTDAANLSIPALPIRIDLNSLFDAYDDARHVMLVSLHVTS